MGNDLELQTEKKNATYYPFVSGIIANRFEPLRYRKILRHHPLIIVTQWEMTNDPKLQKEKKLLHVPLLRKSPISLRVSLTVD